MFIYFLIETSMQSVLFLRYTLLILIMRKFVSHDFTPTQSIIVKLCTQIASVIEKDTGHLSSQKKAVGTADKKAFYIKKDIRLSNTSTRSIHITAYIQRQLAIYHSSTQPKILFLPVQFSSRSTKTH